MKLTHINKTYHNKNNDVIVFNDLSLDLPNHGCITIYGESGSGKTTLFQLIAGLDHDYNGTIENNDKVEYLFQEIELFENLSVYENLLFATLDEEAINQLIEKLEMTELKNQKVKKLSNGEKRRVQIMRSLLNEPDVLLMDEPSASLDQKNAVIVCNMIKQLSKEITVVITTHDEALFDDVADISYRIDNQQLVRIKNNEIAQCDKKAEQTVEKENRKSIYNISKLYLKAHRVSFMISLLLLIMFSFAAYTGFYYNDSSGEKQRHNVWNYSTNLIYTFPDKCEITTLEGSNQVIKDCMDYDLFTVESLNKTVEKNKDIIAYALVWDSENYNLFDYEKMEKMAEEEQKGKVFSNVEALKNSFYSYLDIFQIVESKDGAGFVNPETAYIETAGIRNALYRIGDTPRVFPYEMVDMEKLPIIAGEYPKKDDEVVIGNDFAQSLMKVYEFENEEQLIGKELALDARSGFDDTNLPDNWENKDLNLYVFISGITSYENVFENRMYFKRNAFQSTLADIYHYDVNKLKVHGEKFLIDPSKDTQSFLADLNVNSPLVNDSYHIFNGEDNVYIEWSGKINQDQSLMKKIIAVFMVISLLLLLLHRFFFKKQLRKEAHIMKQCNYSPIKIEGLANSYLLVITAILSIFFMLIIIPGMNEIALTFMKRSVLDWSTKHFIYSILFVSAVYEIGTIVSMKYLTRSKKR